MVSFVRVGESFSTVVVTMGMYLLGFCFADVPSGRQDLNLRPPAPKAGALAKLSYAPETCVSGGYRAADGGDFRPEKRPRTV